MTWEYILLIKNKQNIYFSTILLSLLQREFSPFGVKKRNWFTTKLLQNEWLPIRTSTEEEPILNLVPKGVHENRTKGVENKVDDTLKLVVFLECAQC